MYVCMYVCTTWSTQYLSAVHPVTWVRCLFDRLSISDFGPRQITPKVSFRIHRWDTEIRFVTKFGKNRPLRSCRKVAWITTPKNLGSAGLVPAPNLPKIGRSRPKVLERCHPLTCLRIPNLVRIGCALPDLFRKDWFSGPKSQYNRLSAYKVSYSEETTKVECAYNLWKCADAVYPKSVHACRNYSLSKLAGFWDTSIAKKQFIRQIQYILIYSTVST